MQIVTLDKEAYFLLLNNNFCYNAINEELYNIILNFKDKLMKTEPKFNNKFLNDKNWHIIKGLL